MSMLRRSGKFSKRRLSAQGKPLRLFGAGAALVGIMMLALAVRLGVTLPAVSAQGGQQGQMGPDPSGQPDPPSRVARISLLAGSVSVEPAGQEQFSAAEANYPLTTGDRMYADAGSNGELQTGQLAVRLGQQTDVTVTAMTDTLAQFGLGQGSVHLRSFGIDAGETVELDTPNVAVTVLQPGDVRVDVDANSNTTVSLLSGQVQVDGNGLQQVLEPGQRVRLIGSDPVAAQWQQAARGDGLDRFSGDRDQMYESAEASESQYVNPGTIGAEDLTSYGSWENDGDYGGVWYPRGVAADWQPYSQGRWAYVSPWGWTWVESEPWGFAPFHYGRWNRFGNRWGWIPGPVVVRPVYSPALVVFVGGAGVTAWFPLGPREPYQPWYHTSTVYVNRVNVSNIYNRNAGEVRRNYEQRTTNIYINNSVQNRVYVNRQVATVAMPERSFAAGHGVAREVVRMNPRDLAGAPVMQRPPVAPERPVMGAAPSRPVPTRVSERPVLASHGDVGGRPAGTTQGGFGGGRAGDPRDQPAPVSRPGPGGRPTPGQPTGAVPSAGTSGAGNGYGGGQPAQGSPRQGDSGQGRPGQGNSTIGVPAAAEGGSSNGRPGGATVVAPVAKPAPVENPPTIGQPRLPVNRVEPPVSADPAGNDRARPGFNRPLQGEPNQPTRNQPLAPVAPVRTEPVAPVRTPPPAAATPAPVAPVRTVPPAAATPPPPPPAPRPVPAAAPAQAAPPRPAPGPRPAPAPAKTPPPPPATPAPKG